MRRACLLAVMGCVLAVPAGAAERPPVAQPRLVARIDGLIATAAKGGSVTVLAKGAVTGGGWRGAKLLPMKAGPGDLHTIVVEFVAIPPPPGQAVIAGLLPVAAGTTLHMRRGIFSVRVVSGSNEITTQILK